jgi:DegV family protein with EDD domain
VTVKVVTDSSCDLPEELIAANDIEVVPLTIRFGAEEFVDRRDLTSDEFWRRCDASPTLPETAAPSPGAFETAFRAAADAGHDAVVAILLSGGLSATLQAAQLAADTVGDRIDVRVVDSRLVSMAMGLIVLDAARMATAGKSAEDIAGTAADEAHRTQLFATFDTLDNLRKGGRIGRAQAFFGTVLSMKPVVKLVDGVVEAESRQRTRSKSMRYLVDKVREAGKVENLTLMSADAPDDGELLTMLTELVPREDILLTKIGAVIGTHSGPRALGVAFQLPSS